MTPRELDILRGMVEGLTNTEIAERLILSAGTVKWYVKQLYGKLGVHSRDEAITQAVALGFAATPFANVEPESQSNLLCPLINPLPQDVSDRYIGNVEKLAQLASLFQQQARLISIYGRAGAGKTALACKALGDLRHAEPNSLRLNGIVSMSAIGTGITLNRLFADLGRLLTEKDQAVIDAISRNTELASSQKIGLLLEKIRDKRIVLLLDNLETIQNATTGELIEPGMQQFIEMTVVQNRALTVLITSREPLLLPRSLKTWEHLISLEDGLPLEDAVALLRRFDPSGATGLRDAPSEELREVVEQLGGFPRALESVAGMLLEDPLLRLVNVKQNLNLLEGEISAAVVRQALSHLNDEAMCVLQAIAIFGQPVNYKALAYLLTPYLADSTLRTLLGRLIRACFVKMNHLTQEFVLHPLDQTYCYNQIPAGTQNEAKMEALPFTRAVLHQRAANYYRERRLPRSSWRQAADLEPQINEFKHLVRAGNGDEAARVLLDIDRDHLWEWGNKDLLRQLYPTLEGHINDPHLAYQVARRRAWLMFFEVPEEADREFTRLLEESQRMGIVKELADDLDDLAQTFRRNNRDLQQGIEHHQQALVLYRQIGDRRGEADALGGLGAILSQTEPAAAIECLLAAADIQRDLGNLNSVSFVLTMLGAAYDALGAFEQAEKTLEDAVRMARESGSLDALSRAYSSLARFYVYIGNIERGHACIEEAIAITREFAGVPITVPLMFWIGATALYMALANDAHGGVGLLERAIRDASAVLPQMVPFGNFWLILVLMLGGEYQRARSLLPLEPETLLSGSPRNNISWFGALFIKTGELDAAAVFLKRVLTMSATTDSYAPGARHREVVTLPMLALAHAGLALLNRDPAMAAAAAELTRRALRVRSWQTDLYRALISLLIQESGGEILMPVSNILASIPTHR
jgi:DNA-binding CsgD family transcriptional regulator/tetratricopeptide (TPR) repeat protein